MGCEFVSCCGPLRAGKRTKCSGQALNCLGVPFFNAEKGTPYGVGVHVDETGIVEEDMI